MPEKDLKAIAEQYKEKLSQIKIFLADCDGVMTDGRLYWSGEEAGWVRFFHVQDGYAFKYLKRAGLQTGIISGGDSPGLQKRCEGLGVDYAYLGNEDKRKAFTAVLEKSGLKPENILYIGDEFFDIPLLKKAGFAATTNHASLEVKEVVDYVINTPAGKGSVREMADILRYAQGIEIDVPDF